MDQINRLIETIRTLSDAQIDCGIGKGRDVFFAKLSQHSSTPEMLERPFDWYIAETNACLTQIQELIAPHSLPKDYHYFLMHYGGIAISNENLYFEALGFGPMVEEWYSYLVGDDGDYENGFLKIGTSRIRNSNDGSRQSTYFFLDLGNTIQRDSVIEVFGWKLGDRNFADLFKAPQSYSACWSKIADSFTQWLEIATTTSGSFEHLNRKD